MSDNIFYSTQKKTATIKKKEMLLEPNEKIEPAKNEKPSTKAINTYVTTLPYPIEGKIIENKRYFDSWNTNFNIRTIYEIQEDLINKAKVLAYKQGYDAFINVKVDVFSLNNGRYEVAISGDFVKVVS